ncbi:MAG: pyrroloquinoline quinone precursor peptide PqqA [Streptosporangiaceae bacterium]
MRSDRVAAGEPPRDHEDEPQVVERLAWFPPDFQDFETAMEVTAYALRR